MFVCMRPECPNINKQPLYCLQCSTDEPSPHDHRIRPIAMETTSLQNQWITFRNDVGIKVASVNTWLENYSGLLDLLTRSTGIDTVQRSIRKLQEVAESVSEFYESEVQVHVSAENLTKLGSTKQHYEAFSEQLRQIPSLEGIGLPLLWDVSGRALETVSAEEVFKLSTAEIEAFTSLRNHALEVTLAIATKSPVPAP